MRKAIAIAALLTPIAVVGSAVATPPAMVSGTPPIRATFEDATYERAVTTSA